MGVPAMQFAFSLTTFGATLMLHSGITTIIIEQSKIGWFKILSAVLLLANSLGVLAILGRLG